MEAKRAFERRFQEWAAGGPYESLVGRLGGVNQRREPYFLAYEYLNETVRTIEVLRFAAAVQARLKAGQEISETAATFFKDYYEPIDTETFVAMMEALEKGLPEGFLPQCYRDQLARYGSLEAWRDSLFAHTLFTHPDQVAALRPDDLERVSGDPACALFSAFQQWYEKDLRPIISDTDREMRLLNRDYMRAQMAFEPDKAFYPDANLTLRIAYGQVAGYRPSDGIWFNPVSTLKGIVEKDNPEIFDYNIPQVLRDIYAAGGVEDQPVCFLATNHTSGGNSGSPVLNADGHLVGINFDRVWEGTMSDLDFDPAFCRNISLDIRYLLFVVEQVGGAGHLLEEMTFID